jgi:hypothetical protein
MILSLSLSIGGGRQIEGERDNGFDA